MSFLQRSIKPIIVLYALIAIFCYSLLWNAAALDLPRFNDLWNMVFVGLGAATIANSTGMGGGVVFLPAFEYLGGAGVITITAGQIVGMSFVIQSFGMTTGSMTWISKIYREAKPDTGISSAQFWHMIGFVLMWSIPSLLITQYFLTLDAPTVLLLFKGFSIALGIKLLIATKMAGNSKKRTDHLDSVDYTVLGVAGVLGGVSTALFSIGVGEFVALYLFIRNFPLVTCAAPAVILSATTVLIGLPYHLMNTNLPWDILAIVIPGAMLGGFIARSFAYLLGNKRLKIFAALWIIISSSYMLIR